MKISVIYVIIIIYELSEQNNLDNKKLNIKLLSKPSIKVFKEEFNIKLIKTLLLIFKYYYNK